MLWYVNFGIITLANIRVLKYQIQPNCRGRAVENGACVKVIVQLSFCGIKTGPAANRAFVCFESLTQSPAYIPIPPCCKLYVRFCCHRWPSTGTCQKARRKRVRVSK